jgi:hypothetical protein
MPIALGYDTETRLINGEQKMFPENTTLVEGCGWTFNTNIPPATEENKDCVLIFYNNDWRIVPANVKPEEPTVI